MPSDFSVNILKTPSKRLMHSSGDSSDSGLSGAFATRLIHWQEQYGRHDLPWQTRDAYRVWISEIMLQQTQVATVIPYYRRFLQRFPDVVALAEAPVDEVLKIWAGLGYYARARNLHHCAQTLVARYAGEFPRDPEALAGLPGIGRSTAAAISIFAFGTRAAILDGNVKRVLARHFGIEGFPGGAVEKSLWQLAESLLPPARIEAYTQGLMDLGATVCTRSKPVCDDCPLRTDCIARRDARQAELPTARPGKILPERKTQVIALTDGHRVLLERRPPLGIWGGLLSLPELDEVDEADDVRVGDFVRQRGFRLLQIQKLPPLRHTFSHFHLTLYPSLCRIEGATQLGEPGWEWLPLDRIDVSALPSPIARLLKLIESRSF